MLEHNNDRILSIIYFVVAVVSTRMNVSMILVGSSAITTETLDSSFRQEYTYYTISRTYIYYYSNLDSSIITLCTGAKQQIDFFDDLQLGSTFRKMACRVVDGRFSLLSYDLACGMCFYSNFGFLLVILVLVCDF